MSRNFDPPAYSTGALRDLEREAAFYKQALLSRGSHTSQPGGHTRVGRVNPPSITTLPSTTPGSDVPKMPEFRCKCAYLGLGQGGEWELMAFFSWPFGCPFRGLFDWQICLF